MCLPLQLRPPPLLSVVVQLFAELQRPTHCNISAHGKSCPFRRENWVYVVSLFFVIVGKSRGASPSRSLPAVLALFADAFFLRVARLPFYCIGSLRPSLPQPTSPFSLPFPFPPLPFVCFLFFDIDAITDYSILMLSWGKWRSPDDNTICLAFFVVS